MCIPAVTTPRITSFYANAIDTGATLVTSNDADFMNYPRLTVEYWSLVT